MYDVERTEKEIEIEEAYNQAYEVSQQIKENFLKETGVNVSNMVFQIGKINDIEITPSNVEILKQCGKLDKIKDKYKLDEEGIEKQLSIFKSSNEERYKIFRTYRENIHEHIITYEAEIKNGFINFKKDKKEDKKKTVTQ